MYRTQVLMFRTVSKLSQAAAHPRRGTNYTRNGISCKECAYATQQEQKKQRRKPSGYQRFTCKKRCKDTRQNYGILIFVLCALFLSTTKHKAQSTKYEDQINL